MEKDIDVIELNIRDKKSTLNCSNAPTKHHNTIIWNAFILLLILIVGYLYYYTNEQRVNEGYFTSAYWMFMNSIFYVIFFGLVSGFLIAFLLSKTSINNK